MKNDTATLEESLKGFEKLINGAFRNLLHKLKTSVRKENCMQMFIAALLIIAKSGSHQDVFKGKMDKVW